MFPAMIDQTMFKVDKKEAAASRAFVAVGVVMGGLALVALAAVAVGVVFSRKRGKRNYEKLPLITEK